MKTVKPEIWKEELAEFKEKTELFYAGELGPEDRVIRVRPNA